MMINMTPRQRASIWSDIDFAYTQLDSAISLFKRKEWELSEAYVKSVKMEIKKIERSLK